MKSKAASTHARDPGSNPSRLFHSWTAIVGLAIGAILLVALFPGWGEAATAPSLGTAGSFAVLAGSAVTNTGPTSVIGDLGVSPGSAVTGFPPGVVTGGATHLADAVAIQAQVDVTTAYNNLAGQACDTDETGNDLGGLTLVPGTYCFTSVAQLTGALTLDGQAQANPVFIFQIGTTLTTASASVVALINGASSCNVFWQVGSSATLGTGTTFSGNILALASITATTGTSVNGRLLARNGAVTLDSNTISNAACAAPSTSTPSPTSTTTETPTSTATSTPTLTPVVGVNTATPTLTAIPNTATPTLTPIVGVNTATPTLTPIIGVNTATPTLTPIIGVNTATPTLTPIINVNTATPTLTPIIGVNTATPTLTPIINVNTATPTLTPIINVNTATPTLTPIINVNTATPTRTPIIGVNTATPTRTPIIGINTATPVIPAFVPQQPVVRPPLFPNIPQRPTYPVYPQYPTAPVAPYVPIIPQFAPVPVVPAVVQAPASPPQAPIEVYVPQVSTPVRVLPPMTGDAGLVRHENDRAWVATALMLSAFMVVATLGALYPRRNRHQ